MSSDDSVVAIAITVATLIAVVGLAFILVMVYKKKTRASTRIPQTLVSSSHGFSHSNQHGFFFLNQTFVVVCFF